ncbi:hypothetical protein G3N45_02105 [Acinetobacter baumannii]|nr:hypothetical protein [Acinetobacter baumannii]
MAVPEQTPFIEYTANGVTTSFALEFDCENKDHLIVTLDGVEPPVGNWSLTGGNVVFSAAPASGSIVAIQRNTPFKRTTDYQSYNNSFRPGPVNDDFDAIWLKLQELGYADWLVNQKLAQEILDRIAADEQMLDYILNQDNALKADYISRDAALKQYIDQMIALVTGDPSFSGLTSDFVLDTASNKTQKEINAEQAIIISDRNYREIHLSALGAKFDGSDETAILQQAVDLADEFTTIVFDKSGFKFSSVNYGTKSVSWRGGVKSISPRRIPITVYFTGAGIISSGQYTKFDSLDFKSTGNKDDGNNINLIDNPHTNGTWIDIKNCAASGFSGVVLGFKDVIDSKISGFVPNNNNLVFRIKKGAWVASTTLTLEKVYAQQNNVLFDSDDCDHCTMIDCIYEYNTDLGQINEGSWTIINLYSEGNSAKLKANNTALTILKMYTMTANDGFDNTFTTSDPYSVGSTSLIGRQLSAFDFRKEYETYRLIPPSFGSDTWTKIGNIRLETAGSCVITIVGANGYGSTTGAATEGNSKSVIICHKRSGGVGVPGIAATWHTVGNTPPITDVRIVDTQTSAGYEVYVLQKNYGYLGVAVDVFKAELFKYDIKTSQPKPTGGGSGDVNTATMYIVPQYVKIAAGAGYVGSDGTNPLLGGATATTVGAAGGATALPATPLGYITVSINGTARKIPYYNV